MLRTRERLRIAGAVGVEESDEFDLLISRAKLLRNFIREQAAEGRTANAIGVLGLKLNDLFQIFRGHFFDRIEVRSSARHLARLQTVNRSEEHTSELQSRFG